MMNTTGHELIAIAALFNLTLLPTMDPGHKQLVSKSTVFGEKALSETLEDYLTSNICAGQRWPSFIQ